MLQTLIVGNVGGVPQIQSANGHEFASFRVAHNESYTTEDGVKHENTMWVDVTISCDGGRPKVLEYLLPGTLVLVQGPMSTLVYSSAKDRCMKAGVTIRAAKIELLGGRVDDVPRRLFTSDGIQYDVVKYYHTSVSSAMLLDMAGRQYKTDENGWISKLENTTEDDQSK